MHQSNAKLVQVCGFCGGAQYELTRCSGCGAGPVISASAPLTHTNDRNVISNHTRRHHSSRSSRLSKGVFSTAIMLTLVVIAQVSLTEPEPKQTDNRASAMVITANSNGWFLPDAPVKPYQHTETEVRQLLNTTLPAPHQLHYVGVNQSADPSGTVRLNLKPTNQAIVLVLSSYQPVSWVVYNKHNNNLQAIVYGSYHQGSSVTGDIASDTKVLAATTRIGELTVDRSCDCITKGLFQCTGNDPMQTIDTLQTLSPATLVGISNEESATEFDVPQRHLNTDYWLQHKQLQTEIALRESTCIG